MLDTAQAAIEIAADPSVTDEEIIELVLAGRTELFEVLMRRYNQRLFRTVRSVIANDEQAEDVMQDAYLRAFANLAQFEGRARFSTWLIKIAVHESFSRLRKQRRNQPLPEGDGFDTLRAAEPGPEQQALELEVRRILERCIDRLPQRYRTVFILREIEGLATAETADCLELSHEAVKTRLHRARAMLRAELQQLAGDGLQAFRFLGARCDRIVTRTLTALFRGQPPRPAA